MKNKNTALILSILVGVLGIDRFYLGYTGMGVLKLLTGGCLGVLWIIDIVNIATGKLGPADGSPYEDDVTTSTPVKAQAATASYQDLEKIAELHKAGVLTDEEFNKTKNECLGNMYGNVAKPAVVKTASVTTPYQKLEKLAELHKAGVLTDEEFTKAKNDCLANM